ncbi:XkdQ/YqbQ family protein [Paenibacillus hamazuiensis]|uniref:XkdQ/YqbQ family protein n=1 Tax=Paenibacillus hamazuiensis TaxID=2936508 RepID=UPI00200FFB45|nr:hypothetical protein [Paenibacillus hamazuiensis]
MLEIIINDKKGNLWDISNIVSEVTYKTSKIGKPSSIEFTFIKGGLYEDRDFNLDVGNIVRVKKDGQNLFFGYVFAVDGGRAEDVRVTAYDQTRYLLFNYSYKFEDKSVTEIIQRIAEDFKLKVGYLADTGYKIPSMLELNAKLLDIICKALNKTLIATTVNYIFYDDFGRLSLRDAKDMTVNISLGDASLVYDYKQKRSIENSFNRVLLVQKSKQEGKDKHYISQEDSHIVQWGLLQEYREFDEKMNEAQIIQTLKNLIRLKNRVERSFQIEALGDARVRAGCYISISIDELGINQRFLVNECTHKFEGAIHTMSLDLMDIRVGDDPI